MKAVRYSSFGVPEQVAELVDEPEPGAPGASQVVVEAEVMPVHPADLLAMEGRYGTRRPRLPAWGGTDGVGRVRAVGSDVMHLQVGDLVPLLFAGFGTWREAFIVDANRLFALPAGDPLPMSVVGVNALTAWAMLHGTVPLAEGAWVVQNAASSAVGHACLQIGKCAGLRVINVVRNREGAERLREAGVLHVLVDGEDLPQQVAMLTAGELPRLAVDAVAGAATGRLAACTAPSGLVLNYGLLSGEAPVISSTDLLFRQVSLRGFWLKAWLQGQDMKRLQEVYCELTALALQGVISAPVAATYALKDFRAALANAGSFMRNGKVLFVGPGQAARIVAPDEARTALAS